MSYSLCQMYVALCVIVVQIVDMFVFVSGKKNFLEHLHQNTLYLLPNTTNYEWENK